MTLTFKRASVILHMQNNSMTWNNIVKKEAKGENGFDLGEVHSVGPSYVVTEKGTISRKSYYIPKYLVRGFDGKTLWFAVTEAQAEGEFKKTGAPKDDEYAKYRTSSTYADIDNTIPPYQK
jgi:hypothetical protein